MHGLSDKSKAFYVILLIALHLAIVLPLAYWLNIWADEASTLYTTQHGILNSIQHAATDEKQAPLYFWIMSLWRTINDSIFFARLFSVICSVAAIKLFSSLAQRFFESRAALLATAFFALHPFLIWASLEIRVYAAVILLSILILRFFVSEFYDHKEKHRHAQRGIFLLLAITALYTNYYLGFLLAGLFAALLITRKWRDARDYGFVMVVAGLAFIPQLLAVRSQIATNTSGFQDERSVIEGLRLLWHHFLTFVLPAGIFPYGDGSPILVLRLWIVRVAIVVLVIFAVRYRRSLTTLTSALAAIVFVVFAGLFAAYFLLGPDFVEIRHTSVLFVPLILFIASFFVDLFRRNTGQANGLGRFTIPATGLLVLLSFSFSLVALYPNMVKRGDWERVGEFIEQNESPGQPIIVFTTFDVLALPYYYHGGNQILPDERVFAFEPEAAFGSENSLKLQTAFVISKIPADSESIWLVVNEKCLTTDACVPLENFVQANYTIEKEQEFYLEKVFFLRKKQQ